MADATVHAFLDFERPIAELEGKIEELRHRSSDGEVTIADEIERLQARVERQLNQTYDKLTAWEKVQVARHPARPHCREYIDNLITDFTLLSGDRTYAEDHSMIGGIGRLEGNSIVVIGQEKGSDTDSRVKHNFGMARPEGYRKAQRLMTLANRFGLPVITFIDTAGAYPGIGAEERGQAQAIATTIDLSLDLCVPFVSLVIGEGGSGGAIAIAAANRVLMLEHSVYSVISPEGCASILWRDGGHATDAANALKLTAQDLLKLGVIDEIVPEPLGAAHRNRSAAIDTAGKAIIRSVKELQCNSGDFLRQQRRDKYLKMGVTSGL